MRLAFLAMDRTDIPFASKESARGMAGPTERHFNILKRAVRYLISHRACIFVYEQQRWPAQIRLYSDSDWAGCPVTRKSTSGLCVCFGKHCWYTKSSTQVPISLSSGEAEYYALTKAGSRALGFMGLADDLGINMFGEITLQIDTDSSAAKGIAVRRGVGKIRHLETSTLWVQQAVANRKFTIKKIDGKVNPADIGTKGLDETSMLRHLKTLNTKLSNDRSSAMPKSLMEVYDCDWCSVTQRSLQFPMPKWALTPNEESREAPQIATGTWY